MARPLRVEYPGAVYHVTSRGNAQAAIFLDDSDRELFLHTLAGVISRFGWVCHAYCLMDNHYHLVIETPGANLCLGMLELCRYVVLNPVRANMVKDVRQWMWSSYCATIGIKSPPAWLGVDCYRRNSASSDGVVWNDMRSSLKRGQVEPVFGMD